MMMERELEKRIVTIYKDSLERLWVGTIEEYAFMK